MSFADTYFSRYKTYSYTIQEPPQGLLKYIVVIPVYMENGITDTLNSLTRAQLPHEEAAEVILVFNHPAGDTTINKKENKNQYLQIQEWSRLHSAGNLKFYTVWAENLPDKFAGAGLARKIGMDIALQRFNRIDQPEGFILSLDADTRVEPNYFIELERSSKAHPTAGGCLYYFEHPLEGTEFTPPIYQSIIQYELHLRYYKHALAWTGFSYSNYTVGSCFGVKATVYARHGGMNRQQAGEDFYFLNKLFPHEWFIELTGSCVSPSPRPSGRVVFGTGPVVRELSRMDNPVYYTYNPKAFSDLKSLFQAVPQFYNASLPVRLDFGTPLNHFLEQNTINRKLTEIRTNTSNPKTFTKRFFLWFDGFKVVKYLNFAHETYYEKVPVEEACTWLMQEKKVNTYALHGKELLLLLRNCDKQTPEAN